MNYNDRAASIISNPANQVGSVVKAYGKDGELVIRLWDTFPENTEEPLWVEIDSLPVPLFIASLQTQGTSKAVVTFDDFESQELAAMLVGKKLFSEIADNQFSDGGDDWDFLIGYRFVDMTSNVSGVITDFVGNEMNPLIEVEISGESYFLPIADELVEHLDQKKRTIKLRFAEGIFDL